jgi:polyhydroxybutyrate depolymerase
MAEEMDESVRRYQEPGDYLDSVMASNLERWFVVHIPPQYEPGEPMPLVLNLHGRSSNAIQQRDASRMNQKADEEGFIVVYPQALGQPTTWFGVLFGEEGQPDMAFFAELIRYLERQISVDPARIYATGISNGATMVNRLGCEMSVVFAAVAPVAGAHSGLHLCEIVQPVSMLAVHGTEDQIIPFEGVAPDVPSVQTWVEAWAERNGCLGGPRSEQPYEDVLLESWDDCDDGTAVGLYAVEGGGHTWLGLEYGPSGGFIPEVGATDVIWEFFKAHPKRSIIRDLPGENA